MSPLSTDRGTLQDAIIEVLNEFGGTGSISEVKKIIVKKYGERWKDIGTTMADMVPQSTSSNIPDKYRVLTRIGLGLYCLTNSTTAIRKQETTPPLKSGPNSNTHIYSYKNASELLERKNQLQVILNAANMTDLSSSEDHDAVQGVFRKSGWETEVSKSPVAGYRLDAYSSKTGVEIERSLIDAIHRSLFRSLWAYQQGQLDCLVFIVPTYKEPRYSNVTRDIEAFKEILPFPILVVGVEAG
jgi:hypothetical protein